MLQNARPKPIQGLILGPTTAIPILFLAPTHSNLVPMFSLSRRFRLACRLWLIWVLIGSEPSQAASGDYLIDVWMAENGLPNSSVTSIAQTPDGYLWVATYNGLARFDGVRFFTFHPANTPALQRARVRKLYLDSTGTLWINTYDGSLTSWREGKFTLEWKGSGSPDAVATMVSGRADRPVFLLHTGELIRRWGNVGQWQTLRPPGMTSGSLCVEDGAGVIWGRGRDQKLWRLKGDQFELIASDCGLEGTSIKCLAADPRGRIWVGTEKEMAVWDSGHFESMTPTNGEPDLNVSILYPAPDGDVWVGANDRVRRARDHRWVYEAEALRGLFANRLDRAGVLQDRAGGIWLYHYGKGIFHIRPDGETRQVAAEPNFPGERVDCLYEDQEGNLWTGVDRGGLVRLRQKRFVALTPGDAATKAAVSVAEDADGAIWVGTYGAGFFRWRDGQTKTFPAPGDKHGGFVFSLCPDSQSRMWLSAGEEDLFLHTPGKFQPATPAVHGVKALLAARDGRLWIGTKSGLACWTQGQLRQFRPEDGVLRIDVRALAEDSNGVVWAGAGDGTLYRVQSNHVDSFQAATSTSQPIWSLSPDKDGTVWVGTFRGGLLRFQEGRFARFTTRDGLPDDVICQILDDQVGRLWIGSQRGIFSVAKTDLRQFADGKARSIPCTAYGKYDGLPSLECSGGYQPAACRTRDGRLLFTTLKGVVSVKPETLAPNRLPPPVVIEEVLVDGRPQTAEPVRVAMAGGPAPAPLEVPPGKRQLEFRFTGLSFVSPDQVRFRYRLVGLEKEMMEAGTRRYAQYSFLRPGNYSFEVTACNNDGVWNPMSASIAVHILPHFYETWWFPSLVAILSAAAVAGTVRQVVVRRMRHQLEHLERQRALERDRTRIAKDIHDDLGAGLTQITLLSELARREPSEQAGPHLERISDSARKLTRTIDEIVWAVDPQHDTLNGLMDYISAFTEDFLRTAGIRCRMDMPADLPMLHLAAELRYNLFLALKEALNNVVKHAQAKEVRLGLRLEAGSFTLTVEDDGRGIVAGSAGAAGRIVAGHGLPNLEKRLRSIGGQCRVASVPGQGTRIEMTVRVERPPSPIVATVRNVAPRAESSQ